MAKFQVDFKEAMPNMVPYCRIFCDGASQEEIWVIMSALIAAFKGPAADMFLLRKTFFALGVVKILPGVIEARLSSNGLNRDKIYISVDYGCLSGSQRQELGEKIEQLTK